MMQNLLQNARDYGSSFEKKNNQANYCKKVAEAFRIHLTKCRGWQWPDRWANQVASHLEKHKALASLFASLFTLFKLLRGTQVAAADLILASGALWNDGKKIIGKEQPKTSPAGPLQTLNIVTAFCMVLPEFGLTFKVDMLKLLSAVVFSNACGDLKSYAALVLFCIKDQNHDMPRVDDCLGEPSQPHSQLLVNLLLMLVIIYYLFGLDSGSGVEVAVEDKAMSDDLVARKRKV